MYIDYRPLDRNLILIDNVDSDKLIDEAGSLFQDAEKSTIDGIKFTWDDKWIHLRKSNTEPIMRIYSEAKTKQLAQDLVKSVKNLIN